MNLNNRWFKNFLPKRSHSLGKQQNWIILLYESGRTSKHIENIGDRGSNLVAVNQILILFLLAPHVLTLFSVNIHYFISILYLI